MLILRVLLYTLKRKVVRPLQSRVECSARNKCDSWNRVMHVAEFCACVSLYGRTYYVTRLHGALERRHAKVNKMSAKGHSCAGSFSAS